MKRIFTPIAAGGLLALVAAPAAAIAQDAIVTIDLNMRAGPSTAFPVVDVLPGRTPVDVHGCIAGFSWCDVSADDNRGWVSAAYLSFAVEGSYLPLVEHVSEYEVPIVSFSVGNYWDSYYRSRPWYGERSRWRNRWQANWRDMQRDRRDLRVDRREYRLDRRDNRRDVRFERREGFSERPRGEVWRMERQEWSGSRSGGERMDGGQRGRE